MKISDFLKPPKPPKPPKAKKPQLDMGKQRVGKPPQMGLSKHYSVGHSGKSPKFRHALKREAEAEEVKSRILPILNPLKSVGDLGKSRK